MAPITRSKASKRARIAFTSLPNELKTQILNIVPYSEATKLCKTTKILRNHYLIFGLFPTRIEELKLNIRLDQKNPFYLDSAQISDTERFQLWDNGKCKIHFFYEFDNKEIGEYSFQKRVDEVNIDSCRDAYSALIISTIRSCKTLRINLIVQAEPTLSHLKKQCRLGAREVRNLYIKEYNNRSSVPWLEDFLADCYCPIVDRELTVEAEKREIDFEKLFQKEALNKCKAFIFNKMIPRYSMFSSSNAEFYLMNCRDEIGIVQEVATTLKQGFPGKRQATMIMLHTENGAHDEHKRALVLAKIRFKELLTELKALGDFKWIHPENGQHLSEFSPIEPPEELDAHHPNLLPFQHLEKKVDETLLNHKVFSNPYLIGYFIEKAKNFLFIGRICERQDIRHKRFSIQKQLFAKALPSDFVFS